MQAMTDVSEMAQKLMNSFEDAMAIMDHADTESAAYDKAPAAFEEASSQLEELGFEYEITSVTGFPFRALTLSWKSMILRPGSELYLFSGYRGQ
jgi:hypothetical protein